MDPYFRLPLRPGAVAVVLALLALFSLSAIGCGSSGEAGPANPGEKDSTMVGGSAEAMPDETDEVMEGTVVVEAKEFEFAPSTIRVPAGKPVKIVLNNEGRIEHEILIRDLSVKIVATQLPHEMHSSGDAGMQAMSEHAKAGRFHVHAGPGDEAFELLQADAAGTYDFACEIPGHKEAGMVGRIEVQP